MCAITAPLAALCLTAALLLLYCTYIYTYRCVCDYGAFGGTRCAPPVSRYSVYSLYSYKSAKTDADDAASTPRSPAILALKKKKESRASAAAAAAAAQPAMVFRSIKPLLSI